MSSPQHRIRDHLLAAHPETLSTTIDCADAVASSWDGPATRREEVVEPFEIVLDHAGVLGRYPALLVTGAEVLGESLPAAPVAVPPYVTITSTGPVLRVTLSSGRLVIRLAVFAVERDPVRYVRRGSTLEEILEIERY